MAKGGSADSDEARQATVADVQRIVVEAQKETERSLDRMLKAVSEQLTSLSVEQQASVENSKRTLRELASRPPAARVLNRNISNASRGRVSNSPERRASSLKGGGSEDSSPTDAQAVVVCVDGSNSEVSSLSALQTNNLQVESAEFDNARLEVKRGSWSELNSAETLHLSEEENRWDVAKALGFSFAETKDRHSKSPISTTASKRLKEQRDPLQNLVKSPLFENICGMVIFANALAIGVHANRRVMATSVYCESVWLHLFLCFNVFFTLEIIARIAVSHFEFFSGPEWRGNIFDLSVVVSGVVEEIIQRGMHSGECSTGDMGKGLTALRVIRVLRLVRMMRAFRSQAIFRDFRVMVSSILRCLIPLFWACILLGFIQWIFGVYFVHFVSDYVQAELVRLGPSALESPSVQALHEHYGSLWQAMYTLFQSVTGGKDWSAAADSLHDATGYYHPVVLYIFFIALTTFAVLNVVTGVFVENATKMALLDRDLIIQEKLDRRESYVKDALLVFKEADTDHSGLVTFAEFEEHLSDARVQAFFSCLELDAVEARRLFRLMDADGNGSIDPQEFVAGCMCLKGDAKTMDVAALLLEVKRMSQLWSKCMDHLDDRFEILGADLNSKVASPVTV